MIARYTIDEKFIAVYRKARNWIAGYQIAPETFGDCISKFGQIWKIAK